ncbi:Bug family tripartite tricarboxylate transporter substrate binding protein [Teichococcus vastitatis]|uniref:Tripartite tricarboxylate transporter substrate binding protein n=1 Tax=Teichococcus vastitatis TaxID=2307076 RepID=A0ABS9W624_9PROT|nr:tripartite tricarboxylate transporter substrate binding protein [Pseudoroseomonas vastitatis]MCI0754739.1 tripartite tricarboxylate transporter substrate binding protein [Pseudoroseomonas vastitatis]
MINRRTLLLATSSVLAPALLRADAVSSYPNRPVKIIVPAPPGGQSDITIRLIADGIRETLGQPFVIENRGGASGAIGIDYAAKQPADGYTLLVSVAGGLVVNPLFDSRIPFNALRDLAPVTQFGLSTNCLFVRSGLPVQSLRELVQYAKSRPGELTYASIGNGTISQIYAKLFANTAGINLLHVPFKGGSAAVQELIAGRVDMMIIDFTTGDQPMRDGLLRGLAVTGTKRWPLSAEIPTFQEQQVPLPLIGWNGLFAPKGTPQPTLKRLAEAANRMVQDQDNRDRLLKIGLIPSGTTPDEFEAIIRFDTEQWREAKKLAGAKPE